MIQCGKCGMDGHVTRDCQWESEVSERPAWCGECDRETRLVDHGSYAQRCHLCWAWPAKGTRFHQQLPQHKTCGGCRKIILAWDKAECGRHAPLDIDAAGRRVPVTVVSRPERPLLAEEPGELTAMTIAQLGAELRRMREPFTGPGPMSPAREKALRDLAVRQLARRT